MCFDQAGNVYVSDRGNNRIMKWAPGATQGVMVAGTGVAGSGASQISSAEGLFVDADGILFIADWGNHRIQEWIPGATEGINIPVNGLNTPAGVDFDNNGNMFIADYAGGKVLQCNKTTSVNYTPTMPGSYTAVVTDANGCSAETAPFVVSSPTWYADADGDGYGNAASPLDACAQPAGYVEDNTDCNDSNAAVHPGV